MRSLVIVLAIWTSVASVAAEALTTSVGTLNTTPMLGGLNEPWGLAFLPGGGFLVTERAGNLVHVTEDGQRLNVRGVPSVADTGQGGLLDVMVPADFIKTREVFLSHSKRQGSGAGTALSVGVLTTDGTGLENVRTIFEMRPGTSGGRHFGSRIVEANDGFIYLTMGERGDRPAAQDLSRHNGSVIRIGRDGAVSSGNPFVNTDGAMPEIWSYGHRNPQGAALDLAGNLWVTEHGARGGDEVNRIAKGANYGWPVISYGRHYSWAKIGEGTAKAGMEQPEHYWDPSIAPSGLMIYSGKLWPQWKGHFFVGSLKFDYLSHLDPKNGWSEERLQNSDTGRVRDVREAPDGTIWYLSVERGAVFRISAD